MECDDENQFTGHDHLGLAEKIHTKRQNGRHVNLLKFLLREY